jgi:hypothetical protein
MSIVDLLDSALADPQNVPLLTELFPRGAATVSIVTAARCIGEPVDVTLVRVSSGVVVGFLMDDGSRAVVKVHRTVNAPRVQAIIRAQSVLLRAAVPVPVALLNEPMACGTGVATVDRWLDDGATLDVRPPQLRLALARCAFRFTEVLDANEFTELRPTWAGRYPPPHSPMFNFAATSSGAEWINTRADEALALRHQFQNVGHHVVMHADLRPENVLVTQDGPEPFVSSIYDLDSIQVGCEPWLVGEIARAFSTNWSLDDPMIPTHDEIAAFIDDYQAARGRLFTTDELALCRAGVHHALAYSARCEHAMFPDGRDAPWGPGWRGLLRSVPPSHR